MIEREGKTENSKLIYFRSERITHLLIKMKNYLEFLLKYYYYIKCNGNLASYKND